MSNTYLTMGAEKHFRKIHSKGRWLVSAIAFPFLGRRSILPLSELIKIFKPESESYSGTSEILVNKIIGSEDRSNDFAEGFLPVKSWMESRWSKVWMLMEKGELEEPIDVLEYGGVYFVRDGNHRVSVSKRMKREFIRAKITKLRVPLSLSENISYKNLSQFRKLAAFQKNTNFFTYIPNAQFDIRRNQTWDIIEKEIKCWSPAWFQRHKDGNKESNPEEQLKIWYSWLNSTIIAHIKKESLHYMFPGWGDTDVAMEIIKLWNSYSDPDEISVEDLYEIFISKIRKRRFILTPFHFIVDKLNYLSRTGRDERNLFYERSCIETIRPDFRLPSDLGKKYWRNLYNDLFRTHYLKMKKELGRSPYHNELVCDWYDNVWLPRTGS